VAMLRMLRARKFDVSAAVTLVEEILVYRREHGLDSVLQVCASVCVCVCMCVQGDVSTAVMLVEEILVYRREHVLHPVLQECVSVCVYVHMYVCVTRCYCCCFVCRGNSHPPERTCSASCLAGVCFCVCVCLYVCVCDTVYVLLAR